MKTNARFSAAADRIRCVALDAVGTLITPEPAVGQAYWRAGRKHGSKISEAEVLRRFRASFRINQESSDETDWRTSEEWERVHWRRVVADVFDDLADSQACFEELFAHFARPESWRIYDDVPGSIALFRASGCRVVMASNFDARLDLVCRGFPALQAIHPRVISSRVGFRKPSSQFFQAVAAAGECRMDEVLMVGDDYALDVLAARASGCQSLLLAREPDSSSAPANEQSARSLTEIANWLLARQS